MRKQSCNLFKDVICILVGSVYFFGRRLGTIYLEFSRSCPNRRQTGCTEHARQKIRRMAVYHSQGQIHMYLFEDRHRVLPNLWFGCGSPFTKTTEMTKTTKTTKTTQTATNKELSAGFAEITETTKMTKTTRIQSANHAFPKPRV